MNKKELEDKLTRPLDFFSAELSQVRTGRVTTSLLDDVVVNAYDSKMSVKELGTLTILDAQTLQVTPWDKGVLSSIVSAVQNSNLNLNPSVKGDSVIVPVPPLTEERRVEMTKLVSEKLEEAKNAMRRVRQDAIKDMEQAFNNKEFGEDEKFRLKDQIEDIVKSFIDKAEDIANKKKDDILSIK